MIDSLRGGLIVSCQAYPGEPLRDPHAMSLIAMSAAAGGAVGIRAQGVEDIILIRELVALPLIGLLKIGDGDVFITPTLAHAIAVAEGGADIVAIDGTRRDRPDGLTLAQTIRAIHETTGALVMADAGSLEDGESAQDAGADIVGTTLSGYTGARPRTIEPDFELISEMATVLSVPVFAEGRIRTPAQAREALDRGAYAVVVGTAITHPTSITSWYVDALNREPLRTSVAND
ncbi:MAG: N-acetylmannosamine-6-phosphate 2-epimerase [Candidatus Saccharibacteria bacterium]|nr:N-acetylmannosamine-6-phosphate 2-epimerase [Microbacteriaceae bacterium]